MVTVAGSGVIAALVSFHANVTRQDREFKLKKLEQLWRDVDSECNGWHANMQALYAAMKADEFDPREKKGAARLQSASTYTEKDTEITLVVKVYFAELIPSLAKVDEIKNAHVTNLGDCAIRNKGRVDTIDDGFRLCFELIDAHARFTDAIAAVAKDVRDENIFSPIIKCLRGQWSWWRRWFEGWESY